ncbi:MAG: hypothetical protein ACH346_06765, partial [Chthoniobacterales bacterium]
NLLREEKDRLSGLEGKTRADLLLELCDEALERGSGKLEKISLPGDAVARAVDQFLAGAPINLPNDLMKALEHIAIPDVPLTGITGILFSTLKWAVKKDQTIYKDSLKDLLKERLEELKNDEETINDLKENATKLTQEVRQFEEDAADKERKRTSNFAVSMKRLFTNNTDVPQAAESIRWAQELTQRANISDEDQQVWSALIAEMGLNNRDRLLTFVISAWRQRMSSSQELVETIKKNQQEEMSPLERERDKAQQDLDQAHVVAQAAQEAFKQATEDYLNCEKELNKATEEYNELVSHPLRNAAVNIAAQKEGQEKIARLAELLSHAEEDWKAKEKNAKEREETAIKEESKARRVAAECHNRGERYARAVARAKICAEADYEAWKAAWPEIYFREFEELAGSAWAEALKKSKAAESILDNYPLQTCTWLIHPLRITNVVYAAEDAWDYLISEKDIDYKSLTQTAEANRGFKIALITEIIDRAKAEKAIWANRREHVIETLRMVITQHRKDRSASYKKRWIDFSKTARLFIENPNITTAYDLLTNATHNGDSSGTIYQCDSNSFYSRFSAATYCAASVAKDCASILKQSEEIGSIDFNQFVAIHYDQLSGIARRVALANKHAIESEAEAIKFENRVDDDRNRADATVCRQCIPKIDDVIWIEDIAWIVGATREVAEFSKNFCDLIAAQVAAAREAAELTRAAQAEAVQKAAEETAKPSWWSRLFKK